MSVVAHNISVSSCALSCHVGRSSLNLENMVTVMIPDTATVPKKKVMQGGICCH